MAPTSTAPAATSTAHAIGAFVVLAAVTVSSRDVGIGTLLGGGDTEYSESVSDQSRTSSSSSPVAGATLFLDGAATTVIGAEAGFLGPGSAK